MGLALHRVALVVDQEFAERLSELAAQCHVWAVDSIANRGVAEQVWRANVEPSLEVGVTLFRVDRDSSRDSWALDILGDVVLHHGEFSHDPPLDSLLVFGVSPTPALRSALAERGFPVIVQHADYFLAASPSAV